MKSETPRTDRATIYLELHSPLFKSVTYVTPEFAQQLERELNEATTQLRAWHETFGTSQLTHAMARLDDAEKRAAAKPKTTDGFTSW